MRICYSRHPRHTAEIGSTGYCNTQNLRDTKSWEVLFFILSKSQNGEHVRAYQSVEYHEVCVILECLELPTRCVWTAGPRGYSCFRRSHGRGRGRHLRSPSRAGRFFITILAMSGLFGMFLQIQFRIASSANWISYRIWFFDLWARRNLHLISGQVGIALAKCFGSKTLLRFAEISMNKFLCWRAAARARRS